MMHTSHNPGSNVQEFWFNEKITQLLTQSTTKRFTHLVGLRNYQETFGLTELSFSLHPDTLAALGNFGNHVNRLGLGLG